MNGTFDKLPHHPALRSFRDSISRHRTSWAIAQYLLGAVVVSVIGQAVIWALTGGTLLNSLDGYVVLMLLTLCVLFLVLALATLALAQSAATAATQTISVSQHDEKAFHLCGRVVREAAQSIHVISPYFPVGFGDVDGERQPDATEHGHFLAEAMGAAIARNLTHLREDSRFSFVRIVQLDPEVARRYPDADGIIPRVQLGNDSMADHVSQLCQARARAMGRVDIRVVARPFTPSMPSILVVDRQWVFFSLPTRDSVGQDAGKLQYNFVLELHDTTGKIPGQFADLIEALAMSMHDNAVRPVQSVE